MRMKSPYCLQWAPKDLFERVLWSMCSLAEIKVRMVLKGIPGLSKDVRRRHVIQFRGHVDQTKRITSSCNGFIVAHCGQPSLCAGKVLKDVLWRHHHLCPCVMGAKISVLPSVSPLISLTFSCYFHECMGRGTRTDGSRTLGRKLNRV